MTLDKVWASSFNGKILVMDFDGHPLGSESDFPFKEKLFGLMGIGVAANGDVWAANNWNNLDAVGAEKPAWATSTWGGGTGLTVIYGVAAPVKPPRLGQVRPY